MPSKAPYRHSDGTNCWTRNCSRGHKNLSTAVPPQTVSYQADTEYLLTVLDETKTVEPLLYRPREPKVDFNITQPLRVVVAGNITKKFVTTLKQPFDLSQVNPVRDTDYALEKPDGGLWLTTLEDDGSDVWTRDYGITGNRYQVELKPNATVAVIDSAEDYVALMQRFKHSEKSFAETGKAAAEYRSQAGGSVWGDQNERLDSLNYSKLSQAVDALYVTNKGIAECAVWSSKEPTNKLPKHMATLGSWDIPTVLVFNPEAVQSTIESPAPSGSAEETELDRWFDEEYAPGLWGN